MHIKAKSNINNVNDVYVYNVTSRLLVVVYYALRETHAF